jgi:hypothetical protein
MQVWLLYWLSDGVDKQLQTMQHACHALASWPLHLLLLLLHILNTRTICLQA